MRGENNVESMRLGRNSDSFGEGRLSHWPQPLEGVDSCADLLVLDPGAVRWRVTQFSWGVHLFCSLPKYKRPMHELA